MLDLSEYVMMLNLVSGSVVPFLVGLVTKELASSGLKGVLNAVLSAIAGVATVLLAGDGVAEVQELVNAGFVTFLSSIGTYYGIWKPTGAAQKVQRSTAKVGVGKERVTSDPLI